MCYLNNIIQITRRYLNTVRGQLGFGLDQSEVMKSVTTNHKSDVSPGLGWRQRQVSLGLGWRPSKVSPGLGWQPHEVSPGLT